MNIIIRCADNQRAIPIIQRTNNHAKLKVPADQIDTAGTIYSSGQTN
ncbi:MAG: hypothetical protein JEZ12_26900 [Desulfobacterium sp.]|nr:hypothetical protein [Desulfobacterium sp.]